MNSPSSGWGRPTVQSYIFRDGMSGLSLQNLKSVTIEVYSCPEFSTVRNCNADYVINFGIVDNLTFF